MLFCLRSKVFAVRNFVALSFFFGMSKKRGRYSYFGSAKHRQNLEQEAAARNSSSSSSCAFKTPTLIGSTKRIMGGLVDYITGSRAGGRVLGVDSSTDDADLAAPINGELSVKPKPLDWYSYEESAESDLVNRKLVVVLFICTIIHCTTHYNTLYYILSTVMQYRIVSSREGHTNTAMQKS
jgi:hypothetical protein